MSAFVCYTHSNGPLHAAAREHEISESEGKDNCSNHSVRFKDILLHRTEINRGQCMYWSGEHLCTHDSVILKFILVNTKITLEWGHKQFVTTVHTLFYIILDIVKPYMTIKRRSSHINCVTLALFKFCWWRNNVLLMTSQWNHATDNCDASNIFKILKMFYEYLHTSA